MGAVHHLLGAVAGITSVLLVLMNSQPRVLLAIARDGLLPRGFFGSVHPVFKTPWKSTLLTGFVVAPLSGLLPLRILAELVNIGTAPCVPVRMRGGPDHRAGRRRTRRARSGCRSIRSLRSSGS